VDAVGVCENDKTDSKPLERQRSVPFDKLIESVAIGSRDDDTISSLAARLAAFDRQITDKDRQEIHQASSGLYITNMVNQLLDAIDPDKINETAKEIFRVSCPNDEQTTKAKEKMVMTACNIFDDKDLRNTLITIKQRNEQIIDDVSKDEVIDAGWDIAAKEKAQSVIGTFKRFIEENKDEITALQIIYGKPYPG
jgi:type I restriction enzyme R subunit